jgi:hypothetical protein
VSCARAASACSLPFFHSRAQRLVGLGEIRGELIFGGAKFLFEFQVLVFARVGVGAHMNLLSGAALVMDRRVTGTQVIGRHALRVIGGGAEARSPRGGQITQDV